MASFKFTLKSVPNKKGKHTIQLILIKDRKNTSISIRKSVLKKDWEPTTERVKKSEKDYKNINHWIETLAKRTENYLADMEKRGVPFSLESWSSAIKKKPKSKGVTFKTLTDEIIDELNNANQISHARLYRTATNKYLKFCNKTDITFNEITYTKLVKFQSELIAEDISSKTIKCYFSYIRAVLIQAVKRELIHKSYNPFKDFKVQVRESVKKKEYLSKEELERFAEIELETEDLNFARDLFLLSYYSYGCNFIDLAKLTKNNLNKKDISYRRTKTGVFVEFSITEKSQELWDRLGKGAVEDFLLSLSSLKENAHSTKGIRYYKKLSADTLGKVNPRLKTICSKLEIDKNITFYCARHTFATHMKLANVNVDIIRQALGHKSIATTANYLHQLPVNIVTKKLESAFV